MSYEVATEMVRQAFVEKYDYAPELFDSWLKKVLEEERERIIALLDNANSIYDWHSNCRLCEAIALVKGDNE